MTLTLQSIFHMTLVHNDAFPYYVWLQKAISFRRYHLGKKSMTFWTFAVTLTLTLNTAKHILHTTLDDCSSCWCITVPSSVTKVSAVQKVFWTVTVTLTFYTIAHFQSMFWFMVVYQQTKFGKKTPQKPISSEDWYSKHWYSWKSHIVII